MAKRIILILLLVSLSLNIALILKSNRPKEMICKKMDLNLNAQQSDTLKKIHLEMERKNQEIKVKIQTCKADMMGFLKEEPVDKAKVKQCIDTLGLLQNQLQKNTIDEIIKIKGILNKKQCQCFMENFSQTIQMKSQDQN